MTRHDACTTHYHRRFLQSTHGSKYQSCIYYHVSQEIANATAAAPTQISSCPHTGPIERVWVRNTSLSEAWAKVLLSDRFLLQTETWVPHAFPCWGLRDTSIHTYIPWTPAIRNGCQVSQTGTYDVPTRHYLSFYCIHHMNTHARLVLLLFQMKE